LWKNLKNWIDEIIPKSTIFNIIFKLSSKIDIKILCSISKVSISWYYQFKINKLNNNLAENREKCDLQLIKTLVLKHHRKHWYRMITMLIKLEYWLIFNSKKVLRLMKKYWLLAKIRKKNPYKNIAKATQEHRTFPNILNREFRGLRALYKYWTDISYLYYNWTRAYISILKDMITWEIVSFKVSSNLWLDFVFKTIEEARNKVNLKWSLIHSDQWFHYTNPWYIRLLKKYWVTQSMSRRWNCIDNSPTESFFWHFKDEIDLSEIKSFKELEKYIENYIFYYNNKRPQWNRKKMTPVNYRNHLLAQ
jgi:transposase InsO family protein